MDQKKALLHVYNTLVLLIALIVTMGPVGNSNQSTKRSAQKNFFGYSGEMTIVLQHRIPQREKLNQFFSNPRFLAIIKVQTFNCFVH